MTKIPKHVEALLTQRKQLAMKLMTVCDKLDTYCEKIGVDLDDEDASLKDHVSIYSEPWNAISNTREAIEKALNNK